MSVKSTVASTVSGTSRRASPRDEALDLVRDLRREEDPASSRSPETRSARAPGMRSATSSDCVLAERRARGRARASARAPPAGPRGGRSRTRPGSARTRPPGSHRRGASSRTSARSSGSSASDGAVWARSSSQNSCVPQSSRRPARRALVSLVGLDVRDRARRGWKSTSARVRSGYVAAKSAAIEQPSCEPSSDRARRADGVEDGADVVHARLERRELRRRGRRGRCRACRTGSARNDRARRS